MISIYDLYRKDTLLSLQKMVDICDSDYNLVTPKGVYDFLCKELQIDKRDEEYCFLIALNTKMNVLGLFEISHGGNNCSFINKRGIAIRLALIGASNFIVVHNHPSGDEEPSATDIRVCKSLKKLGEILDMCLMDFIIIGSSFYSFNENHLL